MEASLGRVQYGYTVQTADLNLPCIRRIPKMHSCIENKFMLRRLLCILGLFLPPNFILSSLRYSGLEVTPVRIQRRTNKIKNAFPVKYE